MYYVYFAKSLKNGKVYVGFTSVKPEDRITQHNQNSNIWSKQNKPLKLIYYESYICEKDARLREKFYKSGFGRQVKQAILDTLNK